MIDASWFEGSMLDSAGVAWGYYLLGVLGLCAFWWRITRSIRWSAVRRVLRTVMLVAMLCPFSIGEGYPDMAPAVLMVLMETVFGGAEGFSRVGPTFLGFLAFGAVLGLVGDGLCRAWQYFRRSKSEQSAHATES